MVDEKPSIKTHRILLLTAILTPVLFIIAATFWAANIHGGNTTMLMVGVCTGFLAFFSFIGLCVSGIISIVEKIEQLRRNKDIEFGGPAPNKQNNDAGK